jgi:hypothetical protein
MAEFAGGEDAEASALETLDYAFAPRLLSRGCRSESYGCYNFDLTSYRRVSPDDGCGRTRYRIVNTQVALMHSPPVLIAYEAGPADWYLEEVLTLADGKVSIRGVPTPSTSDFNFKAGLDVKAVEVPDPVVEGEGEGRKGATVFLVCNEKGRILAFDGESMAFLGAVGRSRGQYRYLTPCYAYGEGREGGGRRLRVVASDKGGPCVWDFTDALRGDVTSGREPGVLVHELEGMDDPCLAAPTYYQTSDGGHRWVPS